MIKVLALMFRRPAILDHRATLQVRGNYLYVCVDAAVVPTLSYISLCSRQGRVQPLARIQDDCVLAPVWRTDEGLGAPERSVDVLCINATLASPGTAVVLHGLGDGDGSIGCAAEEARETWRTSTDDDE